MLNIYPVQCIIIHIKVCFLKVCPSNVNCLHVCQLYIYTFIIIVLDIKYISVIDVNLLAIDKLDTSSKNAAVR